MIGMNYYDLVTLYVLAWFDRNSGGRGFIDVLREVFRVYPRWKRGSVIDSVIDGLYLRGFIDVRCERYRRGVWKDCVNGIGVTDRGYEVLGVELGRLNLSLDLMLSLSDPADGIVLIDERIRDSYSRAWRLMHNVESLMSS